MEDWMKDDLALERKRAEEALSASEARYRRLFEAAQDGILQEELRKSEERFSKAFRLSPLPITISTERKGRYLHVNEAFLQMLGYKRGDVIGRTAAEVSFWVPTSQRLEMLRKLGESGRVTGIHTQYTTSAGEILEAEVSAERIELEGQPCMLAIIRDITGTRRLEAQFRQAQKMEAAGRLAGGGGA
jgi:PAS domain S-box-containing protein